MFASPFCRVQGAAFQLVLLKARLHMPTGRGSNKTYGPYYFRFPWIFPW